MNAWIKRSILVWALVLVMPTSLAANPYIPHDKPIYAVTYYTDGTPDGQVYGVVVQYCDLTTYSEGYLTMWPQFVPYDEC